MPVIPELETLISARQQYADGVQTNYFDHPNCVAFSRSDTAEIPGCVSCYLTEKPGENISRWVYISLVPGGVTFWGTVKMKSFTIAVETVIFFVVLGVSAYGFRIGNQCTVLCDHACFSV